MSIVDRTTRGWLRLEGVAVLLASILLYAHVGGSWWLFVLLLLAPDLAMLGYLGGPRLGARLYNVAHVYAGPLVLAALGVWQSWPLGVALALIWTAHIGMDRMLGYGLKLPEGFQHTHLGRIGKPDTG